MEESSTEDRYEKRDFRKKKEKKRSHKGKRKRKVLERVSRK